MDYIMKRFLKPTVSILMLFILASPLISQYSYRGIIEDETPGEPLIGANVIIENTIEGGQTDWDGTFFFKSTHQPPVTLVVSYIGYEEKKVIVHKLKNKKEFYLSSTEREEILIYWLKKEIKGFDEIKKKT